jgi:regulator of protease activity HflC (stomatin/prohibitin superfamily)
MSIFSTSFTVIIFVVLFLFYLVSAAVKILKEYERGVVFRFGRLIPVKGPGLIIIIPFVDKMVKVSLRTITMDVPPQDVITEDNVTVKVNAVVYFRPLEPAKAITEIEDFYYATSQLAQTALRSILGQSQLDDLLKVIDEQTEPWGIKVSAVEVKNVDLPEEMQRAIAKQAEAERVRRAKIIHAEGEFQAAQKLLEAAAIMSSEPAALQLRYLQTLTDMATGGGKISTIVFPIDILKGMKM